MNPQSKVTRTSERLSLSIVIPTLGRKEVLLDTIEALQNQTKTPDEIVISDQNRPPFPEVLEAQKRFPNVRVVASPAQSLIENYNFAWQQARFPIVLYLDDDVIPDSRLVEFHLNAYEKYGETLGSVAGQILEGPEGKGQSPQVKTGKFSRFTGTVWANFGSPKSQWVQFGPGGNQSFRKSLLSETQGFDSGFTGNAYFFEQDMGLRIRKLGYRIWFEPKASLKHLAAPMGGARIQDKAIHTFFYVRNGVRLFRKFGHKLALPIVLVKVFWYSLFKALYNGNLRIFTKGLEGMSEGLRSHSGRRLSMKSSESRSNS